MIYAGRKTKTTIKIPIARTGMWEPGEYPSFFAGTVNGLENRTQDGVTGSITEFNATSACQPVAAREVTDQGCSANTHRIRRERFSGRKNSTGSAHVIIFITISTQGERNDSAQGKGNRKPTAANSPN